MPTQAAEGGANAVHGPRVWATPSGQCGFSTDFPMLGVDPVEAAENSGQSGHHLIAWNAKIELGSELEF